MSEYDYDDAKTAFEARHASRDEFEDKPAEEPLNYWGRSGDFSLVGHGMVGSANCGKYATMKGCLRVDLHNKITLDGRNYAGKVFVRRIHFNCGKPSCPVCYERGWAVHEAGNIERRLNEASKRFGQPEHIIAALPPKFYGLSFEELRQKAKEILLDRGVIGGVLIFHGFRYNSIRRWYWSPHFHCLGFIYGGYGCRGCKKCVKGCGGFVDRSYRCHEKDDWIVKVKGKRKTVFGTAWYQLNHASLKVGVRRFHAATWFGVCSYRKLRVTKERAEELCPICQHELTGIFYCGTKRLSLCERRDSFEDYEEDDRAVFVERVHQWGSGSYEE